MGLINIPKRPLLWKPPYAEVDGDDPLAQGLVCYLPMNENGGTKVFDLSGNGNTGVLQADTHFVPGKFGSALSFDGTGDYVSTSLTMANEPITVVGWLKSDTDNKGSFFGDNTAGEPYKKLHSLGNHSLSRTILYKGDGTDYDALTYSVDPTDWSVYHQLAFTVAVGGSAYIYIDGKEVASGSLPKTSSFTARIAPDYKLLDGAIDNLSVYNRALSPSEIDQLYREPFRFLTIPRERALFVNKVAEAPPTGNPWNYYAQIA